MNRYNKSDKPDWVPPRSVKLLNQVRERVRYLRHSLQTEKACVYWAKALVLWAARSQGGFRHPREMGQAEGEGFLTMLDTEALLAAQLYGSGLHRALPRRCHSQPPQSASATIAGSSRSPHSPRSPH